MCGIGPAWYVPATDWRGTGSQAEYEHVARVPECKRCKSRLNPPDHRPNPRSLTVNAYSTPRAWLAAVRRGEHDAVLDEDWRDHMGWRWQLSRWWSIWWPFYVATGALAAVSAAGLWWSL